MAMCPNCLKYHSLGVLTPDLAESELVETLIENRFILPTKDDFSPNFWPGGWGQNSHFLKSIIVCPHFQKANLEA